MNQPFSTHLSRQFRLIRRDPWLVSLVTWLPIVLFLLLYSIFAGGIARNLPVGIVDLDHSRLSRALSRHYDASSALAIERSYASVAEGMSDLRAGRIYGLVILPDGLERDTVIGMPPQVRGLVNMQFLLVGKIINSALLQTHGSFSAGVEIRRRLAQNTPLPRLRLPTLCRLPIR